jgi:hypothetical protein
MDTRKTFAERCLEALERSREWPVERRVAVLVDAGLLKPEEAAAAIERMRKRNARNHRKVV